MRLLWLLLGAVALASGRGERTPPQVVLAEAHAYLPRQHLRDDPEDCSDYVQRVYSPFYKLPRVSKEMARVGRVVPARRELRPADLVLFSGERVGKTVGHVGIYVGRGKFIHKPSSRPVSIDTLLKGYYAKRYLGGRRVLKAPAPAKGSGASAPKRSVRRR